MGPLLLSHPPDFLKKIRKVVEKMNVRMKVRRNHLNFRLRNTGGGRDRSSCSRASGDSP